MSSVQPSYWNFMSNHGLPGSFSEQSYCLDRHHGLPGSFSEQIRDLARPQRNISSTTDGDIDDIDNGDVPLAEKMIDESHKNVPKFANKSRKRKPTGQVPFSVDVDGDSEPSQKRHCGQSPSFSEAIPGRDPAVEVIDLTIEVIDLTVDVEHCAICSNVLGQGQGYVSRMFVFTTCGCVLCGECLLGNIQEQERESSSVIKDVWCPKSDHFDKGTQEACQIFGLECAICYTPSADEIDQGAPQGSDLIRTSCGAFDGGL
ncbi:hypothetical protein IFR04_003244 [Cadophora malorum]|uniref:Uncharacterized protein n=1 Tax=Cadophora malorum TaxID=108018 RepID=A0A8H8BTP4_9HELO|nr:hypothetical protein IFR04_003244 [Cadophora malorum]